MRRLPPLRARAAAGVLSLLAVVALAPAGCGGGGVAKGATVSVYVARSLCAGARDELRRAGSEAGGVRVRAVCLGSTGSGQRVSLAAVGADARRASEDTSAIAYLEGPDPTVAKFSQPILEGAEIAWISSSSGAKAMRLVLNAVRESHSSDLRTSLREALNGS